MKRWQTWLLGMSAAAIVAGLVSPTTARGATAAQRLSERGPSTLLVGTVFTLASPPSMIMGAVSNGPVLLHACRLGHGVKMLATSAVLLPAGLLVSPFNFNRLPAGWLDGLVDAMQEDYCSRPLISVYP